MPGDGGASGMIDLPATIDGLAGEITVIGVEAFADPNQDGEYDTDVRLISIALPNRIPSCQRQRLFHELIHSGLWDSGVRNLLDDKVEEAVCDAIASTLIRCGVLFPSEAAQPEHE